MWYEIKIVIWPINALNKNIHDSGNRYVITSLNAENNYGNDLVSFSAPTT